MKQHSIEGLQDIMIQLHENIQCKGLQGIVIDLKFFVCIYDTI